MALDAQTAALLAQLQEAAVPTLGTASVTETREMAMGFIALQGEAEPVARVVHRFIPGPGADLPVRVYYPEGDGPFPAYVLYHGSGWTIANLDVADVPARAFVNRSGCAVVAVNYRKAPEHPFPAPLEDCYAALCWTVANAEDLGLDPGRIGVTGDSAGGNLAAAVCLKARDDHGPSIAHQLLVYPVTDHSFDTPSYQENAEGYLLERQSMEWFWGHYLADPADGDHPYASPLRAPDLAGLPPAFVVTAGFDPLRDEGERYADRLREAGVTVRARRYETMIHGFLWFGGVVDGARELYGEMAREARLTLRA